MRERSGGHLLWFSDMTHTIDISALLREISPQAPCGTDVSSEITLTIDPQITSARGEPNWPEIRDRCVTLLTQKTKDLRFAVILSLSLLNTDGLPGLRDGLQVIHGLIAPFWNEIYPRVNPQDALRRIRILEAMSLVGNDYGFLRRLRNMPLARSSTRTFSLKDWKIAKKESSPPDGTTPPNPDEVLAAFQQADKADLKIVYDAAVASIDSIKAIRTLLEDPVRGGKAPDFTELDKLLGEMGAALKSLLPLPVDTTPTPPTTPAVTAQPTSATPPIAEIRSRADVIATLDRLTAYFQTTEPSSLILPLIQQAKDWVGKSFLEIYATVAPHPQEKTTLQLSIKAPAGDNTKK